MTDLTQSKVNGVNNEGVYIAIEGEEITTGAEGMVARYLHMTEARSQ